MERDDLLEALTTQASALADAAQGSLDQAVPPCPGWTMADLVWHTGALHEVWRQTITEHLTDRSQRVYPPRPSDAELLDWYRAGSRRLVDVLRATDSDEPCWTWTPPHNAGFVLRRMAHETAIHRWDADRSVGSPQPVPRALAVDGVDEFLDHFLDRAHVQDAPPVGGSVHLHATDGEGEWLVTPQPGESRFTVERGHRKGAAAVRGPASDLVLALWRRVPLEQLDLVGDAEVAERLVATPDLD